MQDFKYIVWQFNGCEGWSWTGYNSITEAVCHESYGMEKVITKIVTVGIKDIEEGK
jgi:hypothetical protein